MIVEKVKVKARWVPSALPGGERNVGCAGVAFMLMSVVG